MYEPCFKYDGYTYERFKHEGKFILSLNSIFCPGHDLNYECKKRASQNNDWNNDQLLKMYKKLVKMLHVLHSRQSIHRRINPKAIVFVGDNDIKLTNFDSIRVEDDTDKTKTRTLV